MSLCRTGLFLVLLQAAYTDWKEAKIYNRQIAAGMVLWIGLTLYGNLAGGVEGESLTGGVIGRIFGFFLRMAGTCAVLYPFFVCRVTGAGDIKLMGLCIGYLGARDGLYMIFLGLIPAAFAAAVKIYREGRLWERMENLASFAGRIVRGRKLERYQIRYQKSDLIPLAPFLFIGYGIYLLGCF